LGSHSGQGLIETALLVPVLFVVLSGLLEFGFMLNEYLAVQDAVRNASRYSADGQYNVRDNNHTCFGADSTRDFYRQTACLVNMELSLDRPLITMNEGASTETHNDDYLDPTREDDIIISAFGMRSGQGVTERFPSEDGELGWSYAEDFPGYGIRNAQSQFSSADITSRWVQVDADGGVTTPSTGLLIVEVFYHYDQKLKLPWMLAVIDDPFMVHFFAIMPLVSAEPTRVPTAAP